LENFVLFEHIVKSGIMERVKRSIVTIHILLAAILLLLTTCKRDERDNPWDVNANPDAWAPKNLTITDNHDNSVTLTWEYDGSPLIDGFIIDRKEGEGLWIEGFATLSSNQKTFTDNSVTGGIIWSYKVYSNHSSSYSSAIEESIEVAILDGTSSSVVYNGYTYQTVYIDGREWFAENLRTTKYNNGSTIPSVTDNSQWAGLSTPAYCWYNNDQTTYGNTYGALYNWYAVNTGNLCPNGWHVPTDEEWTALTDYVGGASIAGTKLKTTSGWNSDGNGTDYFGFSALPGGARSLYDGGFSGLGSNGYWWSITESDAASTWGRRMGYDGEGVSRYYGSKRSGFSVRCVRDN
jgi:uncharacterized protein (TIGR02145 family)